MITDLDLTKCREVNPAWCKKQGFWPNRFFMTADGEVLLVVQRSRSGDFALNKASLDYLAGSADVKGFVCLAELGMTTPVTMVSVAIMPIAYIATKLKDIPPRGR